jgi:hypothetical protein
MCGGRPLGRRNRAGSAMSNTSISRADAMAEFRLAWERSGEDWSEYAEGVFSTWWNTNQAQRRVEAKISAALSPRDYVEARTVANLRLADVGRLKGSDVRRQLMKREVKPRPALFGGRADSLRVYKFMLACYGVGEDRVNKVCREIPISPIRRIGTLTDNEKDKLAAALEVSERRVQA